VHELKGLRFIRQPFFSLFDSGKETKPECLDEFSIKRWRPRRNSYFRNLGKFVEHSTPKPGSLIRCLDALCNAMLDSPLVPMLNDSTLHWRPKEADAVHEEPYVPTTEKSK
jgi:hypothetical protein